MEIKPNILNNFKGVFEKVIYSNIITPIIFNEFPDTVFKIIMNDTLDKYFIYKRSKKKLYWKSGLFSSYYRAVKFKIIHNKYKNIIKDVNIFNLFSIYLFDI